jgi:hypothetical protein
VRSFRWHVTISWVVERSQDEDPDQAVRPWLRWAVLGLATIGVAAVIFAELLRRH